MVLLLFICCQNVFVISAVMSVASTVLLVGDVQFALSVWC